MREDKPKNKYQTTQAKIAKANACEKNMAHDVLQCI